MLNGPRDLGEKFKSHGLLLLLLVDDSLMIVMINRDNKSRPCTGTGG